jgi:uncharacterized damage-inducible protein DinB
MSNSTDELAVLQEHLERYRGVTLQMLDLVPQDKFDWKPTEGLRSFAEQFLHIAQVEDFYAHGMLAGNYDFSRLHPPVEPPTRETLRQRLNDTREFLIGKLSTLNPDQLVEIIQVVSVPVQWSLRSWLWYLLEHELHHKAQLSLYLRQIGITPPFFAFVFPAGMRPDIR